MTLRDDRRLVSVKVKVPLHAVFGNIEWLHDGVIPGVVLIGIVKEILENLRSLILDDGIIAIRRVLTKVVALLHHLFRLGKRVVIDL